MDLGSVPTKAVKRSSNLAWLRVLALLGGVGVAGGNSLAWANEPEAIHLDDLLKAEDALHTEAGYLAPREANTHGS